MSSVIGNRPILLTFSKVNIYYDATGRLQLTENELVHQILICQFAQYQLTNITTYTAELKTWRYSWLRIMVSTSVW